MAHHKTILDTNKNGFYSWQQNKQLLVQKRGSSRNILCAFLPPRLLSLSTSLWTWLTVSWGSGEHEGDLPSPHRYCQTILCTITKMTYRATTRLWQGTVLPTYQHRCTSVFYKSTFIFFFLLSAAQVPSARFVSSPLGFRFEEQEEGLFLRASSPPCFFILLNYTAYTLQTGRLELVKEFVFSVVPNRMPYIARLLVFLSDSVTSQRKFE